MRNLTQWSSDDRYEWLSAYIDDELVPHDRQRVEQWLATDPSYQAYYQRLMQMRRGFQGLRDQELVNLTPLPIQEIIEASPPFATVLKSSPPDLQDLGQSSLWKKRSLLALASLGGLGLALCWVLGLRSPWAEPIAHVQSSPPASVASVPSPLITPSQPTPATVQTPQTSTLLVSTDGTRSENQGESGLTFALDQPLLVFPADD
jgi:anti-sigma factor RsiW